LESTDNITDVRFSLGLVLHHEDADKKDGAVLDVIPGSPAAQAGISPDMKLVAVNGRNWTPDYLREAIMAAKGSSQTIDLLFENTGVFETFKLNYHDGEKYPHLERDGAKPDVLSKILAARASEKSK
jgi:predicted metalloprotease with PDZ domain